MTKKFDIYYETHGNAHDPCLILITGIGGQLIDWPPMLIDGLVTKGFYVVTFDNRDAGWSRHYDELGEPDFAAAMMAKQQGKPFAPPYTLEDMATDVIYLMDKLNIKKANIVGGSMGGIIAQYVALNYPERVQTLTLIYTTSGDPSLPPPKPEVLQFFASSASVAETSLDAIIDRKLQLFRIYNHPDYFDETKIRAKLMQAYQRSNDPIGMKRLMLAMVCAAPRTEQLKKLNIPCLIIHGDYDPAFSVEHGKQLAEIIPNSQLAIIEKLGHGLPDAFCPKIVSLIGDFCQQEL